MSELNEKFEQPAYEYVSNKTSFRHLREKQTAYQERFGSEYHESSDDFFILSEKICRRELEEAHSKLSAAGKESIEKLMPCYDDEPSLLGVVEIDVDGRRFALPRDDIIVADYNQYVDNEVDSMVVSVADSQHWPEWLKARIAGDTDAWRKADGGIEINQRAVDELSKLDETSLAEGYHDLAIALRLGDKTARGYKDMLSKETIASMLERFGMDDVADLEKLMKVIDLRIIKTSDRLTADDGSHSENAAKTEVDALMEAIDINDKKSKHRRSGWLRAAM